MIVGMAMWTNIIGYISSHLYKYEPELWEEKRISALVVIQSKPWCIADANRLVLL